MTSIRRRTSILVASSLAVVLALGGLVLFLVVRTALTRQFDDGLAARAGALQSLVRFDAGQIELDIAGEVMPRYQPGAEAELFIVWVRSKAGWDIVERSESLADDRALKWSERRPQTAGFEDLALPDGRPGRALTVEFVPSPENEAEFEHETDSASKAPDTEHNVLNPAALVPPVRVLVAQSREPLEASLAAIGMSIIGVGLVLVLAGVGATSWAVRRGTRPLANLSREVAALGPGTLDRRVNTEQLPSELAVVAERLNALLGRLSEAFARERRFTSAASHELRTPIAELRMLLEVGLSQPRSAQRWEQTAREGMSVLERAQQLCEALLQLSRTEVAHTGDRGDDCCDLAVVLRDQSARAVVRMAADPTAIQLEAPHSLLASAEAAAAASIVRNLFDNALQHGDVDAAHPVICRASCDETTVVVTISNQAPDLSADDADRLFEPFWQKEPSREGDGGFGLGLAVSRALAEAADGHLDAALTGGRLVVTLHLPRSSE